MRTQLWLGATPHRLATDLQKNLKMNFTTATSKDRPHNKDKQHMPQLQCTTVQFNVEGLFCLRLNDWHEKKQSPFSLFTDKLEGGGRHREPHLFPDEVRDVRDRFGR